MTFDERANPEQLTEVLERQAAKHRNKGAAANGVRVDGRLGNAFADQSDHDHPGPTPRDREPDSEADQADEADEADESTTWEPVDLGPWLRDEIRQARPSVGAHRDDGLQLVYAGREHAILGETESGKTWLALSCVAAELALGNRVVYIHYEEGNPGSTIERLRLLDVDGDVIANQLRFVAPARAARSEWVTALLDPAPTLVVHDGVNEAMSLIGADIMAAEGASAFRRRLVTPFLRVGAASIACDHFPKDRDGRGRDAYGSVHKGNALDGARIVLENTAPFGRRMRGVSRVFVTKDRPGQLRAHGRPTKLPGKTLIGTLMVDDSTSSHGFTMRLFAPKDDDQPSDNDPAAELAAIVHGVITALPERTAASSRVLFGELRRAGHQFTDSNVREAVDHLVVAGRLVEVSGKRGAKGYQAVSTASKEERG